MFFKTAGLRTYIWNNRILSGLLIALYPLLMAGLVWAVALAVAVFTSGGASRGPNAPSNRYNGFGFDNPGRGLEFGQDSSMAWDPLSRAATGMALEIWPYVFAGVAVWFAVAFFFNVRLVGMMAGSRPVTRKEEPELYNLLENLCIARGLPTPRLEIIETHARNAFASGVSRKTHTVTVTRGLIQSLTPEELEAVLGHELTHIINRDVLLVIVCVVFTGMLGFASQMAWRSLRYAGRAASSSSRDRGGANALPMLLFSLAIIFSIGYGLTLLTRFALSRRREFMADAGSVDLTHRPEAMIAALQRIAGRDRIPDVPDDVALMCLENSRPFLGLFATHPPLESRIAALAQTSSGLTPDLPLSLPPAPAVTRFAPQARVVPNPWKQASTPPTGGTHS